MKSSRKLSGSDFQKVKSLFDKLVNLSHNDRREHIEEKDYKPSLLRKVETLLAINDQGNSAFDHAFTTQIADLIEEQSVSDLPVDLDRFKIIRFIGGGENSEVFEALQLKPTPRRVAIKLLSKYSSKETKENFKHEQNRIVNLTHPYICQTLSIEKDLNDGFFIIMELIEGDNLVDFANKMNLSICDRLGLIKKVFSAVIYSHAKGIIHCDIKPQNILIRESSFEPIPALIDFGISLSFQEIVGQQGMPMGTVAYASPEQYRGPRYVDVRSDVFSLGKLLATLIGIKEKETESADLLSDDLHIAADTASQVTEANAKGYRGDLEFVVEKACATNPAERYQSVIELSEDVQRYLESRPVKARSNSLFYVVAKFVHRNITLCLFGSAVIVSIIFAKGIINNQSYQLSGVKNDLILKQEELANEYLSTAELEALVFNLFVDATSNERIDKQSRLYFSNTLNNSVNKILSRNDISLDVRYKVLVRITRVFLGIGDLESAQKTNQIIIDRVDFPSPELDVLTLLYEGWIDSERGNHEILKKNTLAAAAISKEHTLSSLTEIQLLTFHGRIYFREGSLKRARSFFDQAYREYLIAGEKDNRLLGSILFLLGASNSASDQLKLSLEYFNELLTLNRKLYHENDPRLLASQAYVAYIEIKLGLGNKDSVKLLQDNLDAQRTLLSPQDIALVQSADKVAFAYLKLGMLADAERAYQDIIFDVLAIRGAGSVEFLNYNNLLIETYLGQGKFDEAWKASKKTERSLSKLGELEGSKWAFDAKLAISEANFFVGLSKLYEVNTLPSLAVDPIPYEELNIVQRQRYDLLNCHIENINGRFELAQKHAERMIKSFDNEIYPQASRFEGWAHVCQNFAAARVIGDNSNIKVSRELRSILLDDMPNKMHEQLLIQFYGLN